jgi:hypothetical protein
MDQSRRTTLEQGTQKFSYRRTEMVDAEKDCHQQITKVRRKTLLGVFRFPKRRGLAWKLVILLPPPLESQDYRRGHHACWVSVPFHWTGVSGTENSRAPGWRATRAAVKLRQWRPRTCPGKWPCSVTDKEGRRNESQGSGCNHQPAPHTVKPTLGMKLSMGT